jgi:RNA polymerase sigma factor (sigma-70 family)
MGELNARGTAAGDRPPGDPDSSDDELLRIIGQREDLEAAKISWEALYNRHVKYLLGVCRRAYGWKLGVSATEDLVSETFIRVYKTAAASYRPGTATAPDLRRQQVRAWLAAIARHIALGLLCGGKTDAPLHLNPDEWQEIAHVTGEPESELVTEVSRLMQLVLTDKEQDIIRSTFLWNIPASHFQRMPESELAELASRYGTNATNIRKIRERALKKLRDALAPFMAALPARAKPNV